MPDHPRNTLFHTKDKLENVWYLKFISRFYKSTGFRYVKIIMLLSFIKIVPNVYRKHIKDRIRSSIVKRLINKSDIS